MLTQPGTARIQSRTDFCRTRLLKTIFSLRLLVSDLYSDF